MEPVRCGWCKGDTLYEAYHDQEWGVPVKDDDLLFEFLVLETFQAGLSWITILKRRENFRVAFDHFDYKKIAKYPETKIIGVEPESSPLLTEGWAGPHRIQGIGADFVPDVLNTSALDEIRTVSDEDSYEMSKRLGREEGLFVGISAGASTHVAAAVATEVGEGSIIVTILPDTGERYYSLESFFEL